MNEELFEKILLQAKEYFLGNRYQELCGIVVKGSDNFTQLPSETKSAWEFSLNPKTFLIKDKIHLVAHSHPFGDAYPSVRDVTSSRACGVPFLIYSCLFDNFVFFDLERCKPYKV